MKKLLLPFLFSIFSFTLNSQTSSVYHVESEYTTANGYRYYFDKLDPQTGVSTRLSQLPVIGFFNGYSFFNCLGHYVFQGVDTVGTGYSVHRLFELDTLGNLIRTIPMDTGSGTWYKACLPSAGLAQYYALRWSTTANQWVLETINAFTGSRTTQNFPQLVNCSFISSDATITRNDILWFGMDDQSTGNSVLIRLDPSNGQLAFVDTLNPGYYYDDLNYDCANDTIYGFIAHGDSVSGAELLAVHGTSGTVIHTGKTAIGSGFFTAGTYTRLADGRFYARSTGPTYLLPGFNVSGPTFTMPVTANPSAITFCISAPRESCVFYPACVEETGTGPELAADQLLLFPNPAGNGALHVQLGGVFSISITDASGRIVFTGKGTDAMTIPVGSFASGLYVVCVQQEQQRTFSKVVIAN